MHCSAGVVVYFILPSYSGRVSNSREAVDSANRCSDSDHGRVKLLVHIERLLSSSKGSCDRRATGTCDPQLFECNFPPSSKKLGADAHAHARG